jgi:hypothetical protein
VVIAAFDPGNKTGTLALGDAYSSPGLPTLVQRANSRVTAGGSITVTLGSAPTVGNLMVAIVTGYPGQQFNGTFPTPTGWTQVRQDTTSQGYQGGAIFSRTVQTGDPAATTFNINGIPTSATVFEFSSAGPIAAFSGAGTNTGSTQSSTLTLPANTLGYFAQEQDSSGTYVSVTGSATLLYDNTAGSNHPSVCYQFTASGTVTTTYSAATSLPFYIGFVLGNASAHVYSNSTATSSGAGAVAVTRPSTGLHYVEYVINTLTGVPALGLTNNRYVMSSGTSLGGDANSLGYRSDGTVVANSITLATLTAFIQGDQIDVAADPLSRLIWFRKNGGNWNNDILANQNPVGAVGGIDTSSINFDRHMHSISTTLTGSVITAHHQTASFIGTPPTGFASLQTVQISQADTGDPAPEVPPLATPSYGGAHMGGVLNPNTSKSFSPAGPITTVGGSVQENGTPVAGRKVEVYDRITGELISSTVSDASGNYSVPALGRAAVRVVGSDPPTYNSIVYDNVIPS